jgi:formate dehydrogenase subunit gamma
MATPETELHPTAKPSQPKPPVRAPNDDQKAGLLVRYSHGERLAHWGIAITYILLFLSGLAMFHPFFFWTAALFGGGTLMRILHPFIGVALAVLLSPYAARLWADNKLTPYDWKWARNMFAYMNKRSEHDENIGKYNAGQKLMFWSMVLIIAALVVTGVVMWQPYFAPAFSRGTRKAAGVVHAISAFIMFVGIGVHVYAAYWTKGSMKAMTRGVVTRAWARYHHPGWYRRMTGEAAAQDRR